MKKPAIKKKIIVKKKIKFEFTKMVASGNDFIIFDNRRSGLKNGSEIAALLCVRTSGIGADGLIFIEKSKKADFKMRIFNPDGSEAEMCGNGIRCAALYKNKKNMKIETLAGILNAELNENGIKVRMTPPLDMQLNINLNIDGRIHQVNYVNTGVPHSVCFVENLPAVNVRLLGRLLRYHKHFELEGTNVDFVKIDEHDSLCIRTYERGVEDETLACGTGSVAAALIYHHKFLYADGSYSVDIKTKGGEVLKVYFDYEKGVFKNVWLEGNARIVYKGECYV
ncbi:MAG: diaminopimelate epimerase [Candidatus Omnitrophica bacterium]|nr:diaminopimelate epimerase [Candidatus Omnitrophota bacterium]